MDVSQKTLKRFDGRGNFKKNIYNNFLQKKEFCKKNKGNIQNFTVKLFGFFFSEEYIFTKRKYLRNFKVDLIRTMLTLELS